MAEAEGDGHAQVWSVRLCNAHATVGTEYMPKHGDEPRRDLPPISDCERQNIPLIQQYERNR